MPTIQDSISKRPMHEHRHEETQAPGLLLLVPGSLSTRMLMKMMLSMPSTSSSAVRGGQGDPGLRVEQRVHQGLGQEGVGDSLRQLPRKPVPELPNPERAAQVHGAEVARPGGHALHQGPACGRCARLAPKAAAGRTTSPHSMSISVGWPRSEVVGHAGTPCASMRSMRAATRLNTGVGGRRNTRKARVSGVSRATGRWAAFNRSGLFLQRGQAASVAGVQQLLAQLARGALIGGC